MTIKKRYEWFELTEEGFLRKPKDVGPHYSTENINGFSGFDTPELAMIAFDEFKTRYPFECPHELVLVEIYTVTAG